MISKDLINKNRKCPICKKSNIVKDMADSNDNNINISQQDVMDYVELLDEN